MGDLQREIDKFLKLAYNILIKTASKGSQGSPSWQIILSYEIAAYSLPESRAAISYVCM